MKSSQTTLNVNILNMGHCVRPNRMNIRRIIGQVISYIFYSKDNHNLSEKDNLLVLWSQVIVGVGIVMPCVDKVLTHLSFLLQDLINSQEQIDIYQKLLNLQEELRKLQEAEQLLSTALSRRYTSIGQ